jgi:DmsE family decaheme c-type cytochrome
VKVLSSPTIIFVAAMAAWAQTGPLTTPADPKTPQYVGSAVCRTCHPDVWADFYKNPHYRTLASGTAAPENTGCESCPRPGPSARAGSGGKATIVASVNSPRRASWTHASAAIRRIGANADRRSEHTQNDVVCSSCHSSTAAPPRSFLLPSARPILCYDCHGQVRAQFNMPFKHRVNEGVMTCSDCHNPHGSPAPTWR